MNDGQGNHLHCPRICWGVAMESCDCTTPCPEAINLTVITEQMEVTRPRLAIVEREPGNLMCLWCGYGPCRGRCGDAAA